MHFHGQIQEIKDKHLRSGPFGEKSKLESSNTLKKNKKTARGDKNARLGKSNES